MLEIIQDIGAYAGMAAVVGLAVLSALYFSQARDLKRLREWAGRAPERAAEQAAPGAAVPGRVVAQPQPQPGAQPAGQQAKQPTPPAAPRPGAPPVPVQASGAPAAAASAGAKPAAATPAAQGKQGAAAGDNGDSAPTAEPGPGMPAKEGAGAPATEEAGAAAGATAKGTGDAGAPTKEGAGAPAGDAAAPAPPVSAGPGPGQPAPGQPTPSAGQPTAPAGAGPSRAPAPPGRAAGRRPVPPHPPAARRGGQTAILPPVRSRRPWHRRLLDSPRHLVLAIAGVLIVGGAAAFGLVQLTKEQGAVPREGRSAEERPDRAGQPVNPTEVTVSVLNGTTVPGLAAQIGDRVDSLGFQLGNVTNSSDQQRSESVVLFAPEHEREAIAVGRRLRIGQREPVDAESQALGGDATVVVIAGADQTQ